MLPITPEKGSFASNFNRVNETDYKSPRIISRKFKIFASEIFRIKEICLWYNFESFEEVMKKKFWIIAVLVVALGAVFGGIFGKMSVKTSADASLTTTKIAADYREALDTIDNNHAGKVDHEKITQSSIQGMLFTLDPHSSFFTAEEFRKLHEDQSSRFFGIGVSIIQHRDGVYVSSVIPGTPADKAGVHYGDRFLQVDGKDAKDWSSSEVSKNVRGEQGTPVTIEFERAGVSSPVELTITRGGVPLPSIRNYFMLDDTTGYVGLVGGFQETTAQELDMAIADLQEAGMKNLVLDLRNNPGGLLNQATEVVSRFIPRGKTVVSVKGRSQYSEGRQERTIGGKLSDFPIVVMINGGSASASEIVAGALQDYGRALIVGSDSFGKGLVQRVFPMRYGTGLTLTTAHYYTPYGRTIQRDYSNGSIYDYYTHHGADVDEETGDGEPKPEGSPVKTAGGRVFYNGRGIEPDVKATGLALNTLRLRILDAAFFFTRQLAAGKIAGFENFKTDKQSFKLALAPNEFTVDDRLFDAFVKYTANDKQSGLTAANLNAEKDFAKSRLRAEIATSKYSSEAGQQALLETDPQIMKAIDTVPEAKSLLEKNLMAE